MKRSLSLLFAAAIAASGLAWSAQAMTPALAPSPATAVVKIGFICGPGYHLGPQGHYCWPNGTSVPPHWRKACPPGYHLGPEGHRCWRN